MKINEFLSEVFTIISHGRKSKDIRFSDKDIYYKSLSLRAELLRQRMDKMRFLNEATYQTKFIDLEATTLYAENCIPGGCIYKQSVSDIPEIVSSRWGLLIKSCTDSEGNEIPVSSMEGIRYDKYSLTKKNVSQAFFVRNKLIVAHNTDIAGIFLTFVPFDPLAVNTIQSCGEVISCYSPLDSEYPMEKDLMRPLQEMLIQQIAGISMKIPIDSVPDSKTPLAQKG